MFHHGDGEIHAGNRRTDEFDARKFESVQFGFLRDPMSPCE